MAEHAAAIVLNRLDVDRVATSPWLDVKGAAEYLPAYTESAIRGLIARREIPFERTPNGRILVHRSQLDAWVRGEAA